MDVSRINSLFGRRHTRRDAVKYTGLGVSAAAIGAAGFGKYAAAQDATPAASAPSLGLPEGERTYTMFIQTAMGGTWEPKDGEEGVYTLTLTGLPAQTVYFSDRPERVVGTTTTADFLSALGFGAENPPNAALVTTDDAGEEDVLVIELFNPTYTEDADETGASLVYEARILENYINTNLGRVALQQDDADLPSSFAGASLFIDDCADGKATCIKGDLTTSLTFGCCYKFPDCHQCSDTSGLCNNIPGCQDRSCDLHITHDCSVWG
jgi:hypothetical protein